MYIKHNSNPIKNFYVRLFFSSLLIFTYLLNFFNKIHFDLLLWHIFILHPVRAKHPNPTPPWTPSITKREKKRDHCPWHGPPDTKSHSRGKTYKIHTIYPYYIDAIYPHPYCIIRESSLFPYIVKYWNYPTYGAPCFAAFLNLRGLPLTSPFQSCFLQKTQLSSTNIKYVV